MEMKISWSLKAREQLREIFDYYRDTASQEVAKSVVSGILGRTQNLGNFPKMGRKEELLSDQNKDFRYLVEGNYKILYFINNKDIHVSLIFDCRQNPKKLVESSTQID